MARRIELYTAGFLLLLSLLHVNGSVLDKRASENMRALGEDALTHLEKEAVLALRNHTGAHSVGCIEEPKEHERLNCSLISTFGFYLKAATDLDELDDQLPNTLLAIMQRLKDLTRSKCRKCSTSANTCEAAFHNSQNATVSLEELRSLLVLFQQWIVRPVVC